MLRFTEELIARVERAGATGVKLLRADASVLPRSRPDVRAPAISFGGTRTTRSPSEQEPLQRPGHVPTVLDRPHPVRIVEAASQTSRSPNARARRRHRLIA